MLGRTEKEGEPSIRLLRHLQHWLTGRGLQIAVAEVVPESHPVTAVKVERLRKLRF
jgi:hypothetical protein